MAIIKGVPGALSSFIKIARENGFEINSIKDLIKIKNHKITELKNLRPEVVTKIKQEIEELEEKYNNLEQSISKKRIQIKNEIDFEITKLKIEIDKKKSFPTSLFQVIKNVVSIFSTIRQISRLQFLIKSPEKEIQLRLKDDLADLNKTKSQLLYLKDHFESEVNYRMSHIINVIDRAEYLINSPEYKGAQGEIKMLEELSLLPNSYYVYNDVKITLDKWVSYDGKPLNSAQLDHLLVGPTGVYVIETKNWSEEFVSKTFEKDKYTPYEQIQRGSYVLYRYLNRFKYGNLFQKVKYYIDNSDIQVKSIIAIVDSKIPIKSNYRTKVLFLNQITKYIMNGKEILSPEIINKISKDLECFTAYYDYNELKSDNEDDIKEILDQLNNLIKT